jgi:hypothetical protein
MSWLSELVEEEEEDEVIIVRPGHQPFVVVNGQSRVSVRALK